MARQEFRRAKAPSAADWLDGEKSELPVETGSGSGFDGEESAAPVESRPDSWREMAEIVDPGRGVSPPEGVPFVLTCDRVVGIVASWRRSREFVPGPGGRGGRFEPVGFWTARKSSGQRLPWAPVAWRPYEELAYESRKSA